MASITKVSGKSYRVCTDAENDAYDELSFKTDASDVNFKDGTDAESNLGQIKGITSDVTGEAEDVAASIKVVNQLNDSLGGLSFGTDGDGNYGYYGADGSLIPFNSGEVLLNTLTTFSASSSKKTVDCTSIPDWQNKTVDNFIIVVTSASSSGSGGASSAGTASTSISVNLLYNATTGILTIPATSKSASINAGGKDVTPAKTTLNISGKIYYY